MTCETILYGEGGPSGRSTFDRSDGGRIVAPRSGRTSLASIIAARGANETGMPVTSRQGEQTLRGRAGVDGMVTRADSRRRRDQAVGGGRIVASSLRVVSVFLGEGCGLAHSPAGNAERERQS